MSLSSLLSSSCDLTATERRSLCGAVSCGLDLLSLDTASLQRSSGQSYAAVRAAQEAIMQRFAVDLAPLSAVINDPTVLPTGALSIDRILNGGVRTGEVTEVTGQSAVGKTALLLTLATRTAAAGHHVAIIDTTNGVTAKRLHQLYTAVSAATSPMTTPHAASVLSRIRLKCAYGVTDVVDVLRALCAELRADSAFARSCRLLVLDSATAVISPILSANKAPMNGGHSGGGRGHSVMMHIAEALTDIAREFHVAVALSNGSVSVSSSSSAVQPALGPTWTYVATTRLTLTPLTSAPVSDDGDTDADTDRREERQTIKYTTAPGRVRVTLSKTSRDVVGRCADASITACGVV